MTELLKTVRDDKIEKVFINRPKAYNAFDYELIEGLYHHLVKIAKDDDVQGVVITGEGKAFCAGGDLKWVREFPAGPEAAFHKLASCFHQVIIEIRRMGKPVIAAIGGIAAGGGFSLALSCDFRVMGRSATLRQAYTSSGLSVDGGCSFILPRLVGLTRSLEIMAFDKPISPEKALEWGLVTKVADDNKTTDEAVAMTREITGGSLNSFAYSKKLLNESFETPLEAQLEKEREALVKCGGHPDGREGLLAFTEKRRPNFRK
jgi:2-(1,2-epoxy-1,2-dihydrophenyl)acetyl-CoA isomerase